MLKKSIIDFLKDLIIPPICAVCGKISPDYLCSQCGSEIIPLDTASICRSCGRPLNITGPDKTGGCSCCREESLNFTRHRSFTLYTGKMKRVIKKYKYKKIYCLDKVLAEFLVKTYKKYFSDQSIDYIETIPGEHTRILSERFAKIVKIPFKGNIIKIRETYRQSGLNLGERCINVLDSFKLADCLIYRGKNILLIDDVWTTGSTLREASGIIKRGGAKKIFLLTLARGA